MKKIISFLIVFSMLLSTVAFADTLDATSHKSTDNILIKGQITDEEITLENNILTVYLVENGYSLTDALSDFDKIGHIGQAKIEFDGTYSYKFNFDKTLLSDYSLYVKAGDKNVTDSVNVTEVNGEILNVTITSIRDIITDGTNHLNNVEGQADAVNLYGDKNAKYNMLIAYYDSYKKLIGTEILEDIAVDYLSGKYLFKSAIPKNTADVKLFALNQTSYAPLGNVSVNERDDSAMFKDGDIVCFVGDSITHNGQFQKVIEAYFITRFPNITVKFVNRGINMDTGSYIKSRLDWNVLSENPTVVSLMFGMNDCGQVGSSTEIDMVKRTNTAINYWQQITDYIASNGVEVYCMTPTIRDNYENPATTTVIDPVSDEYGLGKVSEFVKELAKEKNYKVIDANYYTDETTKATAPDNHIVGTDRIHPNKTGYFALGCYYLYELGADSVVASVWIDANNKQADVKNADVSNMVVTEDGLTYTYSPKSLPLPYNSQYQEVVDNKFFDVDNILNNEEIKISGLSEGTYEITLNDTVLGEFSSSDIAKGINIATSTANPNQIISQSIFNALENKLTNAYNYQQNYAKYIERFDALGKAFVKNNQNSTDPEIMDAVQRFSDNGGVMPYDYDYTSAEFNTPNTTVINPANGLTYTTTYNPDTQYMKDVKLLWPGRTDYAYASEFWNEFVTGMKNLDTYVSNISKYEDEARALSQPQSYTVVVKKKNNG